MTATFRDPAVHAAAHGTEQAAADSMRPHVARLRTMVLDILRAHPAGLTDDETAALMGDAGRDRLSAARRRCELRDAGLVVATDRRRRTETGRTAIVWRAS